MPKLHLSVARVVKRARDLGATIDPVEHFGDLLHLHRLATEIKRPPILAAIDVLDAPICVGDLEFRRLSWVASEWLLNCAYVWFRNKADMQDLATAWAMAHARDKAALSSATNPRRAEKIIRAWARDTTAPYDAVIAACRHLMTPHGEPDRRERCTGCGECVIKTTAQDDDEPEEHRGSGPALMTLILETDKDPDYWRFEAPVEVVNAALERIWKRWRDADRQSNMRAGKIIPPDPKSWWVTATNRFNLAARDFIARVSPALPVEVIEP